MRFFFWFFPKKIMKKLLLVSCMRQSLCSLLTVRATGFGSYNSDSITIFDSFGHPLPLKVVYAWWFGVVWLEIAFLFVLFFFFSFFIGLCDDHVKIHINPSIYFSLLIQFLLLFAIVLFTLIISNWILFLISFPVIWFFFKFIFKFVPHPFNFYLFCFESFSWLICFFFNNIVRHLISCKFSQNI